MSLPLPNVIEIRDRNRMIKLDKVKGEGEVFSLRLRPKPLAFLPPTNKASYANSLTR